MPRFTVRVELFGEADEDQYKSLHKKMQAKKYFRVIKGREDWYHLPTATYDHSAKTSASTVTNEVLTIAKSVWKDSGVLVTEASRISWKGLRKATASEVKEFTS
jgi:hypothetical protein